MTPENNKWTKLDPEKKRIWIEALRSGKYTQCSGRLHLKGDGFCCLGVLCDLKDSSYWGPEGAGDDTTCWWNKSAWYPPISVQVWVGITDSPSEDNKCFSLNIPVVYNGIRYENLSSLNDVGMSFNEIADVIEAQF